MSTMSLFLKKSKIKRENAFFQATKSLLDEYGEPLKWEIRPVSTKEDEALRDACTKEVPIPGKPGVYRNKVDYSEYIARLLASAVVFPDLLDAELQDSYGVKKPEDLIRELLDNPNEYAELMKFVQSFNGFDISVNEEMAAAKN